MILFDALCCIPNFRLFSMHFRFSLTMLFLDKRSLKIPKIRTKGWSYFKLSVYVQFLNRL